MADNDIGRFEITREVDDAWGGGEYHDNQHFQESFFFVFIYVVFSVQNLTKLIPKGPVQ
jgi:hypothetical protein